MLCYVLEDPRVNNNEHAIIVTLCLRFQSCYLCMQMKWIHHLRWVIVFPPGINILEAGSMGTLSLSLCSI